MERNWDGQLFVKQYAVDVSDWLRFFNSLIRNSESGPVSAQVFI